MKKCMTFYHLSDINELPSQERWLYHDYVPGVLGRYGSLLTQYDTYRSAYIPRSLKQYGSLYGLYNWRCLNQSWLECPDDGFPSAETWRGETSSRPPVTLVLPLRHTEDFKGQGKTLYDFPSIIRWVVAFKYPDTVSLEDGEAWYVKVHAPEVKRQKKLLRFFSSRADAGAGNGFVRVSELWYENLNDWKESIIDRPLSYTAPPWDTLLAYPFFKPYEEMVSMFLDERPECDFLRDLGPYTCTY